MALLLVAGAIATFALQNSNFFHRQPPARAPQGVDRAAPAAAFEPKIVAFTAMTEAELASGPGA